MSDLISFSDLFAKESQFSVWMWAYLLEHHFFQFNYYEVVKLFFLHRKQIIILYIWKHIPTTFCSVLCSNCSEFVGTQVTKGFLDMLYYDSCKDKPVAFD